MPPQTAWIVQKAFWRQEKATFYAQNGVELSTQVTQDGYSAVDVELVAEYVAKNLLTDAGIIQRVVRQNRTLGQRIWQFINDLLGKLGFRNAKERAFLLRARSLYSAALQETQSSFRNDLQMRYNRMEADIAELLRRVEAGEISEEDARAAYDEIYDPEADMAHWGYDNEDTSSSIEKTTDNRPFVKIDSVNRKIQESSKTGGWERQNSFSETENDPEKAGIRDQIRSSKALLDQLPVAAEVTVPTVFTGKNEATVWAINRLRQYGNHVDRRNFGTIYFSEKSIRNGLNYADTDAEKAALAALPQVLKRGVIIGGHGNHKGREKQTITIGAKVALNGKVGHMGVVVNLHGNNYYAHRIITPDGSSFVFDENMKNTVREPSQGVTVSGSLAKTTSTASGDSISQMAQNVNAEIQESKKWTTQYSISPNLEDDFVSVVKNTFNKGNEVYIGTTSDFLTKVLGVDSLPVTMPANKAYSAIVTEERAKADDRFKKDTHYHGLGVHGLAMALESSENPIAAFAAKPDEKSKRANRVVLVTKETMHGKNIVVVEEIDTQGFLNKKRLSVNKIVTAYDLDDALSNLLDASKDRRLLYLDKKRSQQIFAGGNASNTQSAIQRINTDFTESIANFLANVKWEKLGIEMFSKESSTATKTPMQLAMEKAQRRAAEKERQHSYSPKTTEEKRDIVGAFRQFLNGEIDKAALREKIGTDKIGTALDTNLWTGQREYLPSGTDTMAERVVRDAHKEGISVDEYLRQNAEHYTDENGEYNKIAMTAVALERKEISPDGSYSSAEIRQAIEDVCGPLQAYPAIEEGRLDFVKYDKKRRAALWQIFSTATSAKNNPYDEETGNKVLQEKTALKSKTEE